MWGVPSRLAPVRWVVPPPHAAQLRLVAGEGAGEVRDAREIVLVEAEPEVELGDVLGFAEDGQSPVPGAAPLAAGGVEAVGAGAAREGDAEVGAAAEHGVGADPGGLVVEPGLEDEGRQRERVAVPDLVEAELVGLGVDDRRTRTALLCCLGDFSTM